MAAVNCLFNQYNICGKTMKTLLNNIDFGRVVKKIIKTNLQDKTRIRKSILKIYFRNQSKTKENMEKKFRVNHFFKIM